jgi:histone deacetylase 6
VIACLIGFVAETTIQSIKRTTDDTIANWYYAVSKPELCDTTPANNQHQRSKIFVKNSHFVWDPSRVRKMRKKLGNLVKSSKDTLDDMLEEHLQEVQELLLEKKSEFEETDDLSSRTDEGPQNMASGLRSPPLPSGLHTPQNGVRQESVGNALRNGMPPMAMFGVSPKRPRSPVKRPY